ncbi:hypothetical protein, conserved, partial [Eimeria maxima]
EARQKLEKEVAELREQLAARDELKKAYQTLQKENENLQSKLNAVGALGKQAGPSSAGDRSSEEHEMPVSDSHADYAAVAKERDRLAERVKALEHELAILRDSKKAALANTAPPDMKLQGSKAIPVRKERGSSSAGPLGKPQAQLAKGLEEEASAHVGEETTAQERAKINALEREVVTLRQQVADGQKIKEDYAALVEEVKQLQSENDAFKMQAKGPKASPVKDVGENICEETALTAAKVAELVKERDSLQGRVRDLEEELAAFRFTPVSPVKATLAPKSLSSSTSSAPPLQPLLSKKPPAPSSKLGKSAAVSFTAVHSESSPGGAGTCEASSGAAEPPVVQPGRKPSVLKPGEVAAKAYSPDIASEPKADAASPAKAVLPLSQKVPGSLFSKAVTTPAAATPAEGATAAKGAKAKLTVAAAKPLVPVSSLPSSSSLPLSLQLAYQP